MLDHDAIRCAYPEIRLIDDDRGCFSADGSAVTVDPTRVAAERARLDAEAANNAYRSARARAYPPIGDQLDALYHAVAEDPALKATFSLWVSSIESVKAAHPKP
jgi:hypothetical protein